MSYWKSAWKVYKVNMFILGIIATIGAAITVAEKVQEDPGY